jgi:nucleotide-binding universal stress UspA family protein
MPSANYSVAWFRQRHGGCIVGAMRAVLVLVDGTAGGALALLDSLQGARAMDARVVLLAIPDAVWVCAEARTMNAASEWDAGSRQSAQAYVDRVAGGLRRLGIRASGRAASGPAGVTIVSVADEIGADLIVMSTKSADGRSRLVLGSAADQVLRTAHCPVLVLRRGSRSCVAAS